MAEEVAPEEMAEDILQIELMQEGAADSAEVVDPVVTRQALLAEAAAEDSAEMVELVEMAEEAAEDTEPLEVQA